MTVIGAILDAANTPGTVAPAELINKRFCGGGSDPYVNGAIAGSTDIVNSNFLNAISDRTGLRLMSTPPAVSIEMAGAIMASITSNATQRGGVKTPPTNSGAASFDIGVSRVGADTPNFDLPAQRDNLTRGQTLTTQPIVRQTPNHIGCSSYCY